MLRKRIIIRCIKNDLSRPRQSRWSRSRFMTQPQREHSRRQAKTGLSTSDEKVEEGEQWPEHAEAGPKLSHRMPE